MKRSEFLKRLGLGLGAAVAAPSLLEGEDKWTHKIAEPEVCYDESLGKPEKLIFWRNGNSITSEATASYTLEIPPLKKGQYEYELSMDNEPLLSGKIKAK